MPCVLLQALPPGLPTALRPYALAAMGEARCCVQHGMRHSVAMHVLVHAGNGMGAAASLWTAGRYV